MNNKLNVYSFTQLQIENIKLQENGLYIVSDKSYMIIKKDNIETIVNMPFSWLDTSEELGISNEKIPSQNAVKKYIDLNFINKEDDLYIDGGSF